MEKDLINDDYKELDNEILPLLVAEFSRNKKLKI